MIIDTDFILKILPPMILLGVVFYLKATDKGIGGYLEKWHITSTHSTLPNLNYSKYYGNSKWCSDALNCNTSFGKDYRNVQ